MITITEKAQSKIKEILNQQTEEYKGISIQVVGGGCSGFSYKIQFEYDSHKGDEIFDFNDFKIFVDKGSLLYLEDTEVDYIEGLTSSGFKFNNPQVKSTCGCGESFSV